jgi:hypothetical protein
LDKIILVNLFPIHCRNTGTSLGVQEVLDLLEVVALQLHNYLSRQIPDHHLMAQVTSTGSPLESQNSITFPGREWVDSLCKSKAPLPQMAVTGSF